MNGQVVLFQCSCAVKLKLIESNTYKIQDREVSATRV
jgi:hypothetical protein